RADAKRVVDESRIELAAKILAWFKRQLGRKCAAVNARAAGLEALVQAAEEIGQPAAIQFRRDDFETGKTFQYAGHDQCRKSAFDFVRIDTRGDRPFFRAGVPIDPAKAGELVQAERHGKVFGRGPERIIRVRVKLQVLRRRSQHNSARQTFL